MTFSVPPELASHLGPGRIEAVRNGGSGAMTIVHQGQADARFVKYVPHRTNAVDGHESDALVAKARQVALIREASPRLGDAVPPADLAEISTGYLLVSPYIRGRSPVVTLLSGDVDGFDGTIGRLLEIHSDGYQLRSSRVDAGDDLYIARARRRFGYLRQHLPGARGLPLSEIEDVIERVAANEGLLPARHFFPAHGDLNLFNVIEADRSLVVVDQRGVVSDWDPIYDLAKMITTLWIQAGLEGGLYRIAPDGRVRVGGSGRVRLLGDGIETVRRSVARWQFGLELDESSERLWTRVLFAAAVHAVCESACRISVSMSPFCLRPTYEIDKALLYLELGQRLLNGLVRGDQTLPDPARTRIDRGVLLPFRTHG